MGFSAALALAFFAAACLSTAHAFEQRQLWDLNKEVTMHETVTPGSNGGWHTAENNELACQNAQGYAVAAWHSDPSNGHPTVAIAIAGTNTINGDASFFSYPPFLAGGPNNDYVAG